MADDREVRYVMRMVDNVSATRSAMMGTEKTYQQTVAQTTDVVKDESEATQEANANQSQLVVNTQEAIAGLNQSSASADDAASSEADLDEAVQSTNNSLQARQLNFMTTMTSVRALHSSITLVTGAFSELGLVNDAGLKTMRQFGAAADIVVAGFYGFKGITGLIKETTVAETALAAVTAFRTSLQSPWMLPVILAGAAGLGAVAGYGASQLTQNQNVQQNTNNQYNIQFVAPASSNDQRNTSSGALEAMGGF